MISFPRLVLFAQIVAAVFAGVVPKAPVIDLISPRPDANLTSLLPSANNITAPPPVPGDTNLSDTISFVDVVFDGARLAWTRYPSAVFRQVQATSATGPTTLPQQLTDMRLIFSITQGRYRSVWLDMTAMWPQWGEPRLTTVVPPLEDAILPSRYGMDIVDADRYMKAAGYVQAYEAMDVRRSKYEQPFYFFHMVPGVVNFVAVGARDGRVMAFPYAADAVGTE